MSDNNGDQVKLPLRVKVANLYADNNEDELKMLSYPSANNTIHFEIKLDNIESAQYVIRSVNNNILVSNSTISKKEDELLIKSLDNMQIAECNYEEEAAAYLKELYSNAIASIEIIDQNNYHKYKLVNNVSIVSVASEACSYAGMESINIKRNPVSAYKCSETTIPYLDISFASFNSKINSPLKSNIDASMSYINGVEQTLKRQIAQLKEQIDSLMKEISTRESLLDIKKELAIINHNRLQIRKDKEFSKQRYMKLVSTNNEHNKRLSILEEGSRNSKNVITILNTKLNQYTNQYLPSEELYNIINDYFTGSSSMGKPKEPFRMNIRNQESRNLSIKIGQSSTPTGNTKIGFKYQIPISTKSTTIKHSLRKDTD